MTASQTPHAESYADLLTPAGEFEGGPPDEERVLEATVNLVRHALKVERCSLMTLDPAAGVLRLRSATGMAPGARRYRTRLGQGVAGKVAQTGEPILIEDVRTSEHYDPQRAAQYKAHSFICAPVRRHGQIAGVINVTNRLDGGPLTRADLELLEALSGFVSLALENVQLLDTTQRLQELLRDLLDSLLAGVVALDRAGAVTCWNRGAERLLGAPAREAMGRELLALAPPCAAAALRAFSAHADPAQPTHFAEIDWPTSDPAQPPIPLGVTRTELRRSDGTLDGVVMVFEDLSARRELVELKRIDELKSNFIAMISHELRTPLTSMRGSIRLLRDQRPPSAAHVSRQLMEILSNNTERLIRQVDNLLEVSQIQDRSVVLRRSYQDLARLVNDCAMELADSARARNIAVSVEHEKQPLPALIDEEKMAKVIRHLIDNAIKFSRPGGCVALRTRAEGDFAVLSLKDCGPGIDEENCRRIFDRFIQLEPTYTRVAGGAGLGLYIARELTLLHGGTLSIGATGAKGTEFVLRLPVGAPDETGTLGRTVLAPADTPDTASLAGRR